MKHAIKGPIPTNLELIIANSGLTLDEIHDQTGIQQADISRMQNGKMVPTREQTIELCRVLHCTVYMMYPNQSICDMIMGVHNR